LAPHEGAISSGVLIWFGIRHLFLKTAAELSAAGVSLKRLYVVTMAQGAWVEENIEETFSFYLRPGS